MCTGHDSSSVHPKESKRGKKEGGEEETEEEERGWKGNVREKTEEDVKNDEGGGKGEKQRDNKTFTKHVTTSTIKHQPGQMWLQRNEWNRGGVEEEKSFKNDEELKVVKEVKT